uniref:Ephrin-A5b n=1 Tax=Cyprinus carpio TaxID=7962 RepID=A0A8C2EBH8_CYPCA
MLQVEMIIFVGVILWMCVFSQEPSSKVTADRYAVYWNRSNPRAPSEDTGRIPSDPQQRRELFMCTAAESHRQNNSKILQCEFVTCHFGPIRFLCLFFHSFLDCFFFFSSMITETGRRSCLKLKVFVRPPNGCEKTIGVHDRVFVDDKVENALEPRGQYGLNSPSLCSVCVLYFL